MAIPFLFVRSRMLLRGIVILLASAICVAKEPPQFDLIASWSPAPRGGRVNALEVGGNYVYASISNSFRVADISNWRAPRALSQIDLGAPVRRLQGFGEVYAFCGTNGIKVISVLDSTATLKTTLLAGEDARDIAYWKSWGFVAAGDGGIIVLDFTNRNAPTILRRYQTPGPALSVETFGVSYGGVVTMYAWVAAGDAGALVLDVTDPNAITVAQTFRGAGSVVGVGRSPILTMHFVSTARESYSVKINDPNLEFSVQNTNLPFAPDRFEFDSTANAGFMIGADGSYCTFSGPSATYALTFDAVAPQPVTAAALNQTHEIFSTADHTASVHMRASFYPPALLEFDGSSSIIKAYSKFETSERTILLGDGVEGFRKFTLDSSNMIHGTGRDQYINQRDFVPAGTNIIVVGDSIPIERFFDDFSGATASNPVDLVDPTGQKPAADSVVLLLRRGRDDIERAVFSSQWTGLTMLNITDPQHPVKLSSTGPLSTGNPVFSDLATRGTNLFAANGGIVSFSIQPDNSIRMVQRIETEGHADAMRVAHAPFAYVADHQFGLKIYDVSDPANMQLIASCDTPGDAQAVAALDNYVYVADGPAGVQVIDTSNPRALKIVKTIPTADLALAVDATIFPRQLYVANGLAGFSVYNIVPQNTTQLTILGIPNPLTTRTPPFATWVDGVLDLTFSVTVTGGVAEIDLGQIITTNAGTLHIIAETAGDSDYKPARAETVVEVVEAPRDPQTIDFLPLPDITIYDAVFFVNATASSGLPIEFTATPPGFAFGNLVQVFSPGTITVTATQPGNRDIAPASVSRTFEVRDFASAVAHDLQMRNPSLPADQLLPSADPDHDGIPNGAEFLLRSNPIKADSNEGYATAALVEVAGQRYLRITYARGRITLSDSSPMLLVLDLSKPPPYTWQGFPASFNEEGIGVYDLPIDSKTAIVKFAITYVPPANGSTAFAPP